MGAVRHDIRLHGMDFAVFHKDDRAEVVRTSFVARPEPHQIHALMVRAAAQTTGCAVIPDSIATRVPGDPGVATFDLDCWGTLSRRPGS